MSIAWCWPSFHTGLGDPWLEHPPWQVQRAKGTEPDPAWGRLRSQKPGTECPEGSQNVDSQLKVKRSPTGCLCLGDPVPFLPLVHGLAWEIVPLKEVSLSLALSSKMEAAGRSWRKVGRQGSESVWYMKSSSYLGELKLQDIRRLKDIFFVLRHNPQVL